MQLEWKRNGPWWDLMENRLPIDKIHAAVRDDTPTPAFILVWDTTGHTTCEEERADLTVEEAKAVALALVRLDHGN
jgi:hypothetical protein